MERPLLKDAVRISKIKRGLLKGRERSEVAVHLSMASGAFGLIQVVYVALFWNPE